jgi:hypothetical protein
MTVSEISNFFWVPFIWTLYIMNLLMELNISLYFADPEPGVG